MGYVTQTRSLPTGLVFSEYGGPVGDNPPQKCEDFWDVLRDSNQTTTSFRTGRLDTSDEDEDLFKVKNRQDFEKFLRTESGRHQNWSNSYDIGHTFESVKKTLLVSHPSVYLRASPSSGWDWYGYMPIIPHPAYGSGGPAWLEPRHVDASYYGPRAIEATMPTNPIADLGVALAELKREGIPSLKSDLVHHVQHGNNPGRNLPVSAARDHLNIQFGWKPLLNDVKDTARAVIKSEEILTQFERDSGRIVRRRHYFPEISEVSHSATTNGTFAGFSRSSIYWDAFKSRRVFGEITETVAHKQRVWFSGAYSYYLPMGNDTMSQVKRASQKARHLLSLELNAEVLWNLTPWSWLADWNGNIGTNIHNANRLSSDGLVIRYGYLMCESTTDHTFTLRGPVTNEGISGPFTVTFRSTRKERVKAPPYGFGSNPANYTARQWAILAALGLTKADKVLRAVF